MASESIIMFPCSFLGREVELTAEREAHICDRHPELTDVLRTCLGETLVDPDEVRQSGQLSTSRLFVRGFDTIGAGKHIVVVVVTDVPARDWIVTAYVTRRLGEGKVIWKRD